MRKVSKTHLTYIAIIWCAGFICAAAFALMPNFHFFMGNIDKLAHMGAFAFLMLWPALLLREGWKIVLAAFLLFLLGIGIEYAQHYIPRRNPELMDVVFNTLGLAIGLTLGTTIATLATHFNKRLSPTPA